MIRFKPIFSGCLAGVVIASFLSLASLPAAALSDPLPSWNNGPVKQSIVAFVKRVTTPGSKDHLKPAKRIAVFDNDGTLWGEKPLYVQLFFVRDRVKALAPKHPEWMEKQPFKSVLQGDLAGIKAGGEHAVLELLMATHAGITAAEFSKTVSDWINSARHPKTKRLYTEMVYQPMLELMDYLRANQFKVYIVSGGGIAFMRPWVEKVYGIPPEQVIGSTMKLKFEDRKTGPVLVRLPAIQFVNDKAGKPVGIHRYIGRRPVFAFGNSDGDLQMLQWTAAGNGPRFMGLVHHTDGQREWDYDRKSSIGRLDKALDEAREKKWTVVDMKRDWKRVYPQKSR